MMAPASPTIPLLVQLVLSVCWSLVSESSSINPRYRHVFPTQEELFAVLSLANISFASGLLDVVQSSSPPSFSWILNLSSDIPINAWAVYIIVLQKPGHRPRIYIGCSCRAKQGIRARIYEHEKGRACPRYVREALDDGWTLTHSRLVAWCPIPSPEHFPRVRTFIWVLEAYFSGLFFAMYSQERSYGIAYVCPWNIRDLEWDGLCSHNPLMEQPKNGNNDLNFSPEELVQIAAATKKNRQDGYKRWRKENPPKKATAEYNQQHYVRHKDKVRAKIQSDKDSKKHFCTLCNQSFKCNSELEKHNKTPSHLKKVEWGEEGYRCDICGLKFLYIREYNNHNKTKRHLKKLEMGDEDYHCEPCNYTCRFLSYFKQHQKSQRHLENTN